MGAAASSQLAANHWRLQSRVPESCSSPTSAAPSKRPVHTVARDDRRLCQHHNNFTPRLQRSWTTKQPKLSTRLRPMDYLAWMRSQHSRGLTPEHIARAALAGRPALQGPALEAVQSHVAGLLGVDESKVQIVGSARFGISLVDAAPFDPTYSDLNIAVVDAELYSACRWGNQRVGAGPKLPERDLPPARATAFKQEMLRLSKQLFPQFAYVSVAAYASYDALIEFTAERIRALFAEADTAEQRHPERQQKLELWSSFKGAYSAGLPCFPGPVEGSYPGNSSPYVVGYRAFVEALSWSAHRRELLNALADALDDMAPVLEVQCCLAGGSFLDRSCPEPRDIDLVVFYRAVEGAPYGLPRVLAHLTRKFHTRGIDVRFAPCDSEPWLVVKLASFFTSLYSANRPENNGNNRGCALVVPPFRGFAPVGSARRMESSSVAAEA